MTLSSVNRYEPDRLSRIGKRAVVLGGSIAGLCTARVVADAFEKVIVLERDALPDEPVARKGAPQTSHPHVLLEAGRATLEDLFPGFGESILAEGGLLIDAGTEMEYYDEGGFVSDTRSRLPTYSASRPLFEHVVRQRVRRLENTSIWDNHRVTDYVLDENAATVTGVVARNPTGAEATLEADLVVDATGRTSRTPQWLAANGYEAPPVDEVQVDVTYSTIRIKRPPTDRRVLFVPPSPPRMRGAALLPIEDDQWEVIVQGIHSTDAPQESDGFVEFVEGLPVEEIGQLVTSQPWVSDGIESYPYPSNRRHRYERLDRFPDGLVVTGDAVASFNPIYGQGMSVAALEALSLHHVLAVGGLDALGTRFFDRAADIVDSVWGMAVGADFEFPQTSGPKPFGTDLFNRYTSRLLRRAHSDSVLSEAFMRVLRLERSPMTLFRPGIVWRVLKPTGDTLGLRSLERIRHGSSRDVSASRTSQ